MTAFSASTTARDTARDKDREARRSNARRFAIEAARACADARCRDVSVLDVTGLSPMCDFLVIATGVSERQMATVAVEVEEVGRQFDLRPLRNQRRAEAGSSWVAIDLIDVMVHVMTEEARGYYDLDNLWGDAPRVEWTRGEEESPAEQE